MAVNSKATCVFRWLKKKSICVKQNMLTATGFLIVGIRGKPLYFVATCFKGDVT